MTLPPLPTAIVGPMDRNGRRWDRLLWGVEFSSGSHRADARMLIGRLWATEWASSTPYPGEPTRALLFTSRSLARKWCAETMSKWRDGRQHDDCVSRWRVRAVRVRETVHPATEAWWARRKMCKACKHLDDNGGVMTCRKTVSNLPGRRRLEYCIDARSEGGACGPDAVLFKALGHDCEK